MTFLTPLGLLALLGVPVVVVLHLFRRRFKERRVAGLFLFAADALPARAGRTRTRLLKTPSFWLEILGAVALALLLGGLALKSSHPAPHLVVVLDDSASMGAGPDEDTAARRARRWVERRLAKLGDGAEATLVVTGRPPTIRVGPRAPVHTALAALSTWEGRAPSHDATLSLELGMELAGQDGELVFVTDRDPGPVPARVRVVGVGRPLANAAIVSGRRAPTADGTKESVQVDVLLFGERPLETTFVLEALAPDGPHPIASRALVLEAKRPTRLSLELPATDLPLVLRLGDDALDIDNAWTLLAVPRRIVPVALDLPDKTRRLLRLDRVLDATRGVRVVKDAASAGLVFRTQAGRLVGSGIEAVVGAVGDETDAWAGPYLLDRRRALGGSADLSPLLTGVSLEGVIWTAGRGEMDGLPLVAAGEIVLLAEVSFGRASRLVLNLDPERSNLAASPDWPILVSNIVEAARARLPGPKDVNVQVGGEIVWRPTPSAPRPTLVDPTGLRLPARGLDALGWTATRAGLYRLEGASGRVIQPYASSFLDPAESDLQRATSFDRPAAGEPGAAGDEEAGGRRRVAGLLALLALLAFGLDVWVLGRRDVS